MTMLASADATRVDLRTIAPPERHPAVFSTFRQLAAGQAMELVNDHDPWPLRAQFDDRLPGRFGWEVLEAGPATWRVAITRLAPLRDARGCCGGCGCG